MVFTFLSRGARQLQRSRRQQRQHRVDMDTRAMTFMDLRLPVCSRPVQVIDGLQLGLGCARVEQSLAQ